VDNRVEAPSRAPGDGSEGTQPAESSDGASPAAATSADKAKAATVADASSETPDSQRPAAPIGARPTGPSSAARAAAPESGRAGQATAPRGPSGSQPGHAFAVTSAPARNPGRPAQTAPMAVIAGAANGARGVASRLGASFSGLKPKPKAKVAPVRRPGSPGGLPPRPQQITPQQQAGQPTRRALLSLERVEPMSVMKFSFLISLVGWVVLFVAVAVIYFALSKLGVFTKIETTVGLVTYNKTHPGTNAADWFRASRVLEYTALVCTVNAILFTALATVGAALYNLVTTLTGGIEVTLKESD